MSAKYFKVDRQVQKKLLKVPLHVHRKIINALGRIKDDPTIGIKLHGEFEEYYKLRVGDYRIVYTFDSKKSLVMVVKIEHRQGVYR